MTAKATSRSSYYKQTVSGRAKSQRIQIMDCLAASPNPLTRRQVALKTGIRPAVDLGTGRVAEYLHVKYLQTKMF